MDSKLLHPLLLGSLVACAAVERAPATVPPFYDHTAAPLLGPTHYLGHLGIPLWTVAVMEGRLVRSGSKEPLRSGQIEVVRVNGQDLPEAVLMSPTAASMERFLSLGDADEPMTFFAFEGVRLGGFPDGHFVTGVQNLPMYPVWWHELRVVRPRNVWPIIRTVLLEVADLEAWWEPEDVVDQSWLGWD